ncbi:glutathione S-transferase [Mycena rosella]|uniref:glutathione transferase n=1 Tax=Mycena rosella TaxID=1033263 RepID=A0AAD7FRQ3_MYCRO|nr:glutathione S-transferase [Mycena rosella]
MAILKLHGAPFTVGCIRRVVTVLHELQVPFELHQTPAYLEKQPFGQVPYIDDSGFILYETRAIYRYLAAKYPAAGLIPTDPKANAIFEQAASAELTNFDPSASKLAAETVVKPMFGGTTDLEQVAAHLAVLDKKLDAYDAILAKQRYIGGETFTLADLFHLPYGGRLADGGIDIMTTKPNVARWYNELVARPSWAAYKGSIQSTLAY